MPPTELLAAMGKYNEELVNSGLMLGGDGLHPSSKGKRVRFTAYVGDVRLLVIGVFVEQNDAALIFVAGDPAVVGPAEDRPWADAQTAGNGFGLAERTGGQWRARHGATG